MDQDVGFYTVHQSFSGSTIKTNRMASCRVSTTDTLSELVQSF